MLFPTLSTAQSGLTVFRTWMDAVSDNIANMDDAAPTSGPAYQARFVLASPVGTGTTASAGDPAGAAVSGIALGDPTGRLVSDPQNPLADANGMVRYPDIDLGDQMAQMMMAQRGYEANLSVIDRAKDAYQQALSIGR